MSLLSAAALCAFAALIVLAVVDAGFRQQLDHTASLASWAVAAGTLVLAAATFQLARRAREEAEDVRKEAAQMTEQVTLQREQLETSLRPYVYPSPVSDWARGSGKWADRAEEAIPLRNGGPGLALNVRGRAVWNRAPGEWRRIHMYAGTISGGRFINARLSEPAENGWSGATAYVRYGDLRSGEWVTYFRFDSGQGGELVIEHLPPTRITTENDPDLLDEAGVASMMPR